MRRLELIYTFSIISSSSSPHYPILHFVLFKYKWQASQLSKLKHDLYHHSQDEASVTDFFASVQNIFSTWAFKFK